MTHGIGPDSTCSRWRSVCVCAVVAAASIAGCGGDGEPVRVARTEPASTIPQTIATVTPPPATTTTTTKAARRAPKPRAKPRRYAKAPARPAPAKREPKPAAVRQPDGTIPLRCLRRAGLRKPEQRSPGLWAGLTTAGRDVVVDGPYKKASEAKVSAQSLTAVSSADAGGRYVASAALMSKAPDLVHKVAQCLKRSGQ
jgi:hypothetical protein